MAYKWGREYDPKMVALIEGALALAKSQPCVQRFGSTLGTVGVTNRDTEETWLCNPEGAIAVLLGAQPVGPDRHVSFVYGFGRQGATEYGPDGPSILTWNEEEGCWNYSGGKDAKWNPTLWGAWAHRWIGLSSFRRAWVDWVNPVVPLVRQSIEERGTLEGYLGMFLDATNSYPPTPAEEDDWNAERVFLGVGARRRQSGYEILGMDRWNP